MKKIAFLMAFLLLFCCFCACDPNWYAIDGEKLKNDVVSIDLIEYENPNQKKFSSWVPDQFDKLVPFESANATVLETLPAEKTEELIESLAGAEILETYYVYDSPKDICLRLNYENGDFLIVWANYAENSHAGYIGEYGADGKVLSFWGSFSALSGYKDLVNQYFTYQLT